MWPPYHRSVAVSTATFLSLIVLCQQHGSMAQTSRIYLPTARCFVAEKKAASGRRACVLCPLGSETLGENYGATRERSFFFSFFLFFFSPPLLSLSFFLSISRLVVLRSSSRTVRISAVACATDRQENVSRVSFSSFSFFSSSFYFPL